MEKETFATLKRDFGLSAKDKEGFPIEWANIEAVLIRFNVNPVAPISEITSTQAYDKASELQAKLTELGLGNMVAYDCNQARDQRLKNLVDKNGKLLNPNHFPNAILTTPDRSQPCK